MFSNSKRERDLIVEDDTRSSRAVFLGDEDSRFGKGDPRDNLTARLAQNFNAIIELLKERKDLLLLKIKRMYEENADRVEAISRGRTVPQLQNQAKALRDEVISNLVDSSQRMNSTKSLLRRIVDQHNFNQFQAMQKAKGKKFFDRCRQVQNDLNSKTKRFNQMMQQLQKFNERQRQMYSKIEDRKADMSLILRRRDHDYLRKAENIQNQIEKYSIIIKDNKLTRDKKKKQAEIILQTIIDTIDSHQNCTVSRIADIEDLFGGSQDPQDFQKFIKQFENIIDRKFDDRKEDKKEAAVQEVIKIANGYDAYLEQIIKDRQKEVYLMEDINEGLKNGIKTAILEKLFFQDISKDKTRLAQILSKCRSYKELLSNFDGEKARLSKELNRLNHMKSSFGPRWKSLVSEEIRKEELRKELSQIQAKQNELERIEKKCKQSEYANSNYDLTRQILQREMNDLADRGNFGQYKARLKELERLEKQYRNQSDTVLLKDYERLRDNFDEEVRILNTRYADIIADVMLEGEPLSPYSFISKLALRMDIS